MTKEEHIKKLTDILAEATETEDAVCYVTSEDKETLEAAISALSQPQISDDATNGEVILSTGLFKIISEQCDGIMVYIEPKGVCGQALAYSKEWWNAPYKGERVNDCRKTP